MSASTFAPFSFVLSYSLPASPFYWALCVWWLAGFYLFSFIFKWVMIALQYCVTFLLHNSVNQLWVYINISLPLEPPSSPLTPPLWVITDHQAEQPAVHSTFPLVVCLHTAVCMPVLLPHFVPLFSSPIVSTCSLCLHLHSYPANRLISASFLWLDSFFPCLLSRVFSLCCPSWKWKWSRSVVSDSLQPCGL